MRAGCEWGSSPHNFAVLCSIVGNLLCQETTATYGVKAKRLKASWSEDNLLKVFLGYDAIARGLHYKLLTDNSCMV